MLPQSSDSITTRCRRVRHPGMLYNSFRVSICLKIDKAMPLMQGCRTPHLFHKPACLPKEGNLFSASWSCGMVCYFFISQHITVSRVMVCRRDDRGMIVGYSRFCLPTIRILPFPTKICTSPSCLQTIPLFSYAIIINILQHAPHSDCIAKI